MTDAAKDMPELKPCPFCGDVAALQSRKGQFAGYYVACITEDCCGNPSDDGFSFIKKEFAIEAWNTRADLSRPQAPAEGEVAENDLPEICENVTTLLNELERDLKKGETILNVGAVTALKCYAKTLIQAATRSSKTGAEGLVKALEGLAFGEDWNNGTHSKIYRPQVLKALAEYRKQTGKTNMQSLLSFKHWFDTIGSRPPAPGKDCEEHVREIAEAAWKAAKGELE